ncbi:hypothetical protein AJ78_01379 [Emergomyces pasteurianus Ep9510]|uniref:Actin cytoskeleton-regulatory complex protein SLA1 n=1 Tax=Emergomyces pasteurianus Ep9510 TaxID=1447872 RepID=A0A1J9PQ64_9EURO|nr:hypothetical protein AJ78_01379 [Emergomyces pasteurianus Ep9510]
MGFLGVYTALYDYTPQAENELEIREGDLLYVIDKSAEDDWWKAKKKAAEDDEEEPVGLVPNNYVEEAKPIHKAKALYDYTRQTDEEVSFTEQAELVVYDTSDPDWTLVGVNDDFGFAPANYIEITEDITVNEPAPAAPPSLPTRSVETESEGSPTPVSPSSVDTGPAATLAGILHKGQPSISSEQSRPIPSPTIVSRAPQPTRQPTYTPEESDGEDTAPPPTLPRRPPSEQITPLSPQRDPSPPRRPHHSPGRGEESFGVQPSPPYRSGEFRSDQRSAISPSGYHLYNISEMVSVMGKRKKMPTTLGININTGTIFISPEKSVDGPHQEWTADKLTHYSIEGKHVFMDLIRPSKSVDFHAGAKDTANEIVSALGEIAGGYKAEGLREVIAAGTGGARKKGQVLYDFMAQGDDEVTVAVGDEVVILDDSKSDEWWMVRRLKNGREGVVPSSYVELTGVMTLDDSPSRKGTNAGLSTVEQNRLEESRLTKEMARKSKSHDSSDSRSGERQKRDSRSKPKPDPLKTRKWTDRTGTFTVVAEFIGLAEGKIHLHKQNGVKIAVPVSKMSVEDLEYVERVTGQSLDEDKPLSDIRRRSRLNDAGKIGASVKSSDYDWFEFFLKAGVGPHQCERYAQNFKKDSMDETILPDITTETLRTLGLKEGDILRVMKYLDTQFNRTGKSKMVSFGGEEVIGNGEEAAGGLFSGPGGALRNNTRKGRPAPAVQTSDVVDPKAFEGKSDSAKPSSPTAAPAAAGPTKDGITQGFEDSAWEVKLPKQLPATTAAPAATPAPTLATQAAPVTQPLPAPPVGALADLSLLSTPLQPTKVQHQSTQPQNAQPPISQPAPQIQQPQQTGANPTFFSQLGSQQQQQSQLGFQPQITGYVPQQQPMPPRQRPQPPAIAAQGSSLLPPPPDRPLSAPQHLPQNSSFGPPPLQPQLTGIPASTPNIAPPGHSLAELNQQRFQPQFNQQLQPQQTGMGPFGNQMSPQQQPQYGYQSPQPFLNGPQQTMGQQQGFQQPVGPQQTGFPGFQPQQQQPMQSMQPMQTGINSVLPPPMQPQRTGINGFGGSTSFTPSPPPIPPIPHQPTIAPLQPQKTGPPPPVRFGVQKDTKKLTPQQTGLKANLSQASKFYSISFFVSFDYMWHTIIQFY